MIAQLIMRLFHARTTAHVQHLVTTSHAKHVALQRFYEGIIEITDSLAEGYQGEHGVIDFSGSYRYVHEEDPIKAISDLKEWIEKNRYDAIEAEDTFLHNVVDEVVLLCSGTLFLLKRLK